MLSLIGIGLSVLYAQNAEDRKSPEENFFALFKIVFESAKEVMGKLEKRIQDRRYTKNYGNKKQLLTKLLDAFKENSEWNSYLPDHPAIIKFKSEIINE